MHLHLHGRFLPVRLRRDLGDLPVVLLVGIGVGGDDRFLPKTEAAKVGLCDVKLYLQIIQISHR